MELLLQEIKRIPYARNMYCFKNGIYFNTYKRIPKPGDTVYPVDLGLFKFEYGSSDIVKIYNFEVNQFVVHNNLIYLRSMDKTISFFKEGSSELNLTDYCLIGVDYMNKQVKMANSYDFEKDRDGKFVKVIFDESIIQEFKYYNKFVKHACLSFNSSDYLKFIGENNEGDLIWSFAIHEMLKVEKEKFLGQNNKMDRVYSIKNEYWIIYLHNNIIFRLNHDGTIGWSHLTSDYHTYTFEEEILYALSNTNLSKMDARTGEILLSVDIEAVKEKYNCPLYRGGAWVYEDYLFFPSPKRSIEFLVFDKHTLREVGVMRINIIGDDIVQLPGQFCSNFIYSKGKVYINDTADWLRVYDVEFREE